MTILAAFKNIHQRLIKRGFHTKFYRLDNECSEKLKLYLKKHEIEFQRVPPCIHRRNAAERAISIFKDHFLSGLASVNPAFPPYLWDRLVEQAELTINLLYLSRANQTLSVYAQMFGHYDFSAHQLVPPGINVIIHKKANQQNSWDSHRDKGWYIGPAKEHYRCYRVYVPKTRSERVGEMVEFFLTIVQYLFSIQMTELKLH